MPYEYALFKTDQSFKSFLNVQKANIKKIRHKFNNEEREKIIKE